MNARGKNLISIILVLSLSWIWNCQLRASVNLFCPPTTSKADISPDLEKVQSPPCHQKEADSKPCTDQKENCILCIYQDSESSLSYFPESEWEPEFPNDYGIFALGLIQSLFSGNTFSDQRLKPDELYPPGLFYSSSDSLIHQSSHRIRI
jgi:hypothetical protein